jgi:hypothetical protein
VAGTDKIDGIIRAARQAYREFATTPGASPETRQAVAQAVRFLIADLESARDMTGAALTTVGT